MAITGLVIAGTAAFSVGILPEHDCSDDAYRALDFWIGGWDIFNKDSGQRIATSNVFVGENGCSINENWHAIEYEYSGRSLNAYNAITGEWHHLWVDVEGSVDGYVGVVLPEGVQWTTENRRTPRINDAHHHRWSLSPQHDGSVIQHSEISFDEGVTWATEYTSVLRRRASEPMAEN